MFKLKRISELERNKKELEEKIKNLESRIVDMKNIDGVNIGKIDLLEKKLKGERICDTYCKVCENSLEEDYEYFGFGTITKGKKYTCLLDCKCNDFSKNIGGENNG